VLALIHIRLEKHGIALAQHICFLPYSQSSQSDTE